MHFDQRTQTALREFELSLGATVNDRVRFAPEQDAL